MSTGTKMQNYRWYGTKCGFVCTKGYSSREDVDSYVTEVTNACGVEFDFLTIGPVKLMIKAENHQLEWLRDCSGIWFNSEALKEYLQNVEFDIKTEKKMNKYKPNHLYFDLMATQQLILQQLEEIDT